MEAKDLRIDNWVKTTITQEEYQIKSWHLGDEDEEAIGESEGIPLTEEWLIKLGAINKYGSRYGFYIEKTDYRTGYIDFHEDKFINLYQNYEGESDTRLEVLTENVPRYVHQLQNLYHSLTGEELTIKE